MNQSVWRLECVAETVGKALLAAEHDPLSEALGKQLLETVAEVRAQRKLDMQPEKRPEPIVSVDVTGRGVSYQELSRAIVETVRSHGEMKTTRLLDLLGIRSRYQTEKQYLKSVRHCIRQLKKAGRIHAEQHAVGEPHTLSLPETKLNGAKGPSIEPIDWESMQ